MSERFTLASWNVFQGLHHSSSRGAWVQNSEIEDHIAALDADVLVLPELWRNHQPTATWAEDLAASMGYELHQWVSDRPSRAREIVAWRMAILTRIPARRLTNYEFGQFGDLGARAAVQIELTDSGIRITGVHQYGIHLLLRANPRQWLRERAGLRELATNTDVLGGDMNMWGPVVRRDARPLRHVVKGRTYPAARPHSQIDHLLISDRVRVLQADVLADMGSDHLALRAVLQSI